jgi:hypothetical protein
MVVEVDSPYRNSFATTADGATINAALMERMRGYFLWCVCHLLALSVREVLPLRKPGQDTAGMTRACGLLYRVKEVRTWLADWCCRHPGAAWGAPASQCVDRWHPLVTLSAVQVVSKVNSSTCTSFEHRELAALAAAEGLLNEVPEATSAAPTSAAPAAPGPTGTLHNTCPTRWGADAELLGSVLRNQTLLEIMAKDRDNGALHEGSLLSESDERASEVCTCTCPCHTSMFARVPCALWYPAMPNEEDWKDLQDMFAVLSPLKVRGSMEDPSCRC